QPVNVSAGGVLTVRLTVADPAVPEGVGVALSVPLYVPADVDEVTVTVPQFDVFAAHDAGPLLVVLAGEPYATDVAADWPVFPSVHIIVAAVGDVVGVLLQPVNVSTGCGGGFTTRPTDAEAAVPAGVGVALSVPL